MSYKVEYQTLAIMNNGRTGNINQGNGVVYTDTNIAAIPVALDKHLEAKKLVGVITDITKLKGVCI